MSEFILILGIFSGNGIATTSILFPSQRACETARKQALAEFEIRSWWGGQESRVRALCAPGWKQ